jgi:hypothetical protein
MIVYFSWICFSEDLGCTEYHEDYMIVYSHLYIYIYIYIARENQNNKHGEFFEKRTWSAGMNNNIFNCEIESIDMFHRIPYVVASGLAGVPSKFRIVQNLHDTD